MKLNTLLIAALALLMALPTLFLAMWITGYDTKTMAMQAALLCVPLSLYFLFRELIYQERLANVRLAPGESHTFALDGPFDFEKVQITVDNRDFAVRVNDYFVKSADVEVQVRKGTQLLENASLSFVQNNGAQAPPQYSWNGQIIWNFELRGRTLEATDSLVFTIESLRHSVTVRAHCGSTFGFKPLSASPTRITSGPKAN